jgi:hypothetical protein
MKEFVLVISMWANTTYYLEGEYNEGWEYIGNQIILEKRMTQRECKAMVGKDAWTKHYKNEFYAMLPQCYHIKCAGKEDCKND